MNATRPTREVGSRAKGPEDLLGELTVASNVLHVIVRDMLLGDALWHTELRSRARGCEDALDAIALHRASSDRERSFAFAIASRVERCRDGLHMLAMGLPRGRRDMILRGELTVSEATADIRMAAQVLHR